MLPMSGTTCKRHNSALLLAIIAISTGCMYSQVQLGHQQHWCKLHNRKARQRWPVGTCMCSIYLLCYLLGPPPEVPSNFSVSVETGRAAVDISITWDLVHNVSSYRVAIVASGGSAASCPSSCDPSDPCRCTGLGIGEDTTITIIATNCGNQIGVPVMVTARLQGKPKVLLISTVCDYSFLYVYSSFQTLRMQYSTSLLFSRRSQCC